MTKQSGNFEVVRASAGSGKTYRLVLRYLECALQYDNPRSFSRILALTFTNKAAAEMKARILRDLKGISEGGVDKKEELSKLLNISEETLIEKAKVLHMEMLHRYSDIAVMTIDSFVNRLVRSFARDLALEQDFRIELDSDKVIDEAVSQLLNKVGEDGNKAITDLLEGFSKSQIEEDKDARVRQPLNDLGKSVVNENMRDVVNSLAEIPLEKFKVLSLELREITRIPEKILREASKKALLEIDRLEMSDADFSGGTVPKNLRKFRNGKIVELNKTTRKHFLEPETMVRKTASNELKDKALELGGFLSPVYEAAINMLPETESGKRYTLALKLGKRMDLMGTLSELHKEIEKVQTDNNIRTLGAMHEMISRIVRNNPAPFIFERLGNRFSHIFIDEFQDTSITQWHNLVVLYDHALSTNNKTLVVGDGKQAIYRWRNGDYKQLMTLPKLLGDNLGMALEDASLTLEREIINDGLEDNWRSGKEIIEWNNALFEEIKNHLPQELKEVYDGLRQKPKTKFNGGVHLETIVEDNVSDRELKRSEIVVDRIKDYLNQGFKSSDITILVRTNREGAVLAQDLLKANIKPMTEESLHMGRHPGPLAVVALMRWLLRPDDHRQGSTILQCAVALREGAMKLMKDSGEEFDESLELINEAACLDKYVTILDKKSDEEGGKIRSYGSFKTQEMLNDIFPELRAVERSSEPLVGFVGHCCMSLGITKFYPTYAEGMIELAREISGSDESGLHGFLRLWDGKGKDRSVVTGASKDAVQIMTVHKAKGLAFTITIVILSAKDFSKFRGVIPVKLDEGSAMPISAAMLGNYDMRDTSVEDQRVAEVNRVILDQVNVAYVAFTRAIERLDIILELEKDDFNRDEVKTVGELIVKSLEVINDGKDVLEGGDLTPDKGAPLEMPEEVNNVIELDNLQTGESVKHLVSIPHDERSNVVHNGLNARELGTQVHSVLEKIICVDDWSKVKKKISTGLNIGKQDLKEIVSRVEGVLNLKEAKSFFKKGIHVEAERDFVNEDGKVVRPDRIVKDGDVWHVIDYKSTESGQDKHVRQVEDYVNMLKQIEESEVKGWILYTDPLKLVSIL
ncbi:MAG: hypothetical protein COA49_04590 [Bacteroidetes bacterium]|nr:MAG: hypothetical protein COA49_04590 [Bacteroidota bacterium]